MDIDLAVALSQLRDSADELWQLTETKREEVKKLVKRARGLSDTVSRHLREGTNECTVNSRRLQLLQETVDRAAANLDLVEIFRLAADDGGASGALLFPGQPLTVDEEAISEEDEYGDMDFDAFADE